MKSNFGGIDMEELGSASLDSHFLLLDI